jgi:hypothetical protein
LDLTGHLSNPPEALARLLEFTLARSAAREADEQTPGQTTSVLPSEATA